MLVVVHPLVLFVLGSAEVFEELGEFFGGFEFFVGVKEGLVDFLVEELLELHLLNSINRMLFLDIALSITIQVIFMVFY